MMRLFLDGHYSHRLNFCAPRKFKEVKNSSFMNSFSSDVDFFIEKYSRMVQVRFKGIERGQV